MVKENAYSTKDNQVLKKEKCLQYAIGGLSGTLAGRSHLAFVVNAPLKSEKFLP